MLINCSPALACGYINVGFLLLRWGLFQTKGPHGIHLFIFKEGVQHSRWSVSAGEFYANRIRSNDEKLIEMHSTLCNLLLPTSHFLISSQKEDEERKRKEQESQRIATGHDTNGGESGKAQVRAPLLFITCVGSTHSGTMTRPVVKGECVQHCVWKCPRKNGSVPSRL